MDSCDGLRGPSFVQSLKLRAIKTVKTSGLLSFHPTFRHLHQQAFESKVKEDEAKVCEIAFNSCFKNYVLNVTSFILVLQQWEIGEQQSHPFAHVFHVSFLLKYIRN